MTVEVMRGFGVTRRRGTEIGGVLLGKIKTGDDPLVLIYDYETVPCEYSAGPSYVLSDRDREAFREVAGRWTPAISPDQYVVGYFRSHTREGLQLDEVDARQFHEYIDNPLAVALIIKPYATRAAEAGFFLQSGGKLDTAATPLEFQFARAEAAVPKSGAPPAPAARPRPIAAPEPESEDEEPEAEPIASPVPVQEMSEPSPVQRVRPPERRQRPEPAPSNVEAAALFSTYYPVPAPRWKTRILWVAFALAVFGFGALAGYQYAGGHLQIRAGAAHAEALSTPVPDPYSINLSAAAQDHSVLVKWDRDSGAVKAAQRGILTITEGTASKEVKLDLTELRNGTVLYHKVGQEVTFKLELFFRGSLVMAETVTLRLAEGQPRN
jgi:hypothetical protein